MKPTPHVVRFENRSYRTAWSIHSDARQIVHFKYRGKTAKIVFSRTVNDANRYDLRATVVFQTASDALHYKLAGYHPNLWALYSTV